MTDPAPAEASTLPPAYFDDVYAGAPDPWGFTERWYEQRKYALTVAALPRPHYRAGLEIGCSIGVLTALLAPRCNALLAVDVAAPAVDAARSRVVDHPHVRIERATVPAEWPPGTFDLVVLSEVGYYFSPADLARVITRACGALEPGGHLVAVHWRHPVTDYPLSGDTVHTALDGVPHLTATVRHEEADFLLTVYARIPPAARSVAQETGLA